MIKFFIAGLIFGLAQASLLDASPLAPQKNGRSNLVVRESEAIDGAGNYHVAWTVDEEKGNITFRISVKTKGFVGFGISNNGNMDKADIVIGGVNPDGSTYFSDYHGVGHSPVLDSKQNWRLISASENATHTSLVYSRPLNPCDIDEDLAITSSTTKLIWSYGLTDEVKYHGGATRGAYAVNLLDPPMPPLNISTLDKWSMVGHTTMPAKPTTYWCSMHKTPANYSNTRHVVAIDTVLLNEISRKHTHHLIFYSCQAPANTDPDQYFGEWVGKEGTECGDPMFPSIDCNQVSYVWAVGGKIMTFPENVGFPITKNGEAQYFALEVHYDNPESLPGLRFESIVEIYSTSELRPINAGVLMVGTPFSISHIIPPHAESFTTATQCSSECTKGYLPTEGVKLFNIMHHAHLAGRKIRTRQFRNGKELPWPSEDATYDFNYQQNRPIRDHVEVLPGDHLTAECTYSTPERPNVTLSGVDTTREMCEAIFWYYPADSMIFCGSAYDEKKMINRFGISKVDNLYDVQRPFLVTEPQKYANWTFEDVLNTQVDWNEDYVKALEKEIRYNNQFTECTGVPKLVGYPDVVEPYSPPVVPCMGY